MQVDKGKVGRLRACRSALQTRPVAVELDQFEGELDGLFSLGRSLINHSRRRADDLV